MKYERFVAYEGHNNKEIYDLFEKLNNLERQVRAVEGKIREIQFNCNHEYKFSCSGMYEDNYTCSLCGHETEH
jgi:hypothetical protein